MRSAAEGEHRTGEDSGPQARPLIVATTSTLWQSRGEVEHIPPDCLPGEGVCCQGGNIRGPIAQPACDTVSRPPHSGRSPHRQFKRPGVQGVRGSTSLKVGVIWHARSP